MTKLKYKLETNFTKPKSKKDMIKKAQTNLDALYQQMLRDIYASPYYTATTTANQSTSEINDYFSYPNRTIYTGWSLR